MSCCIAVQWLGCINKILRCFLSSVSRFVFCAWAREESFARSCRRDLGRTASSVCRVTACCLIQLVDARCSEGLFVLLPSVISARAVLPLAVCPSDHTELDFKPVTGHSKSQPFTQPSASACCCPYPCLLYTSPSPRDRG
eukprot:363001-Rhodomonas_salina.1